MKTIAISLQKGGTGKTTLAAELAGYGQTILIDADSQGNASAWVGPDSLGMGKLLYRILNKLARIRQERDAC
jgi:cellulose biosynthesis protein BcsQ